MITLSFDSWSSHKWCLLGFKNLSKGHHYLQIRNDRIKRIICVPLFCNVICYWSFAADDIADLNDRLVGLQQAKDAEKEQYESELQKLRNEFQETKDQLTSENMILSKSYSYIVMITVTWRLLFISYKFVKGFLAIILLHVTSSWNFHNACQLFSYNQKRNFSLIRLKMINFPMDPQYKIAHFCNVMSIDMTLQKWAIFIIGVYGENLCLLSESAEISFLVV